MEARSAAIRGQPIHGESALPHAALVRDLQGRAYLHGQFGRSLRREFAVRDTLDERVDGAQCIARRGDWGQPERGAAAPGARAEQVNVQAQRLGVAFLREIDQELREVFAILAEQLLGHDRAFIARADRPPGRIAALTSFEGHVPSPCHVDLSRGSYRPSVERRQFVRGRAPRRPALLQQWKTIDLQWNPARRRYN